MTLTLDRMVGDYEVTELVLVHNHNLYLPQTFLLMVSQRKISEVQAFEIETADDTGIAPKVAHELASCRVGGPMNLSYTCRDQKNHLQSKRQRELSYGQAGSMLKYFQENIAENPSFNYTLQLDCEEDIASIFWADAKMIIDYAHFGDVVTFDTIFGTNKEYRPFDVFVGFNQFRETIIFGAALMFDETEASFTWIFEAFLAAHYILKRWTREACYGTIHDNQGRSIVENSKSAKKSNQPENHGAVPNQVAMDNVCTDSNIMYDDLNDMDNNTSFTDLLMGHGQIGDLSLGHLP